jgi:hypothetical protein
MPLNDVEMENKENENFRDRKRQNSIDYRLREKQKKVALEQIVRSLKLQIELIDKENSNLECKIEVMQMKIDAILSIYHV